jgi:hypothetical protein
VTKSSKLKAKECNGVFSSNWPGEYGINFQSFANCLCLHHQGLIPDDIATVSETMESKYELTQLVGLAWTCPGLRLAQPGGPTDRVSVLFLLFYLKTEAESSFQNAVILFII